MQTAQNRILSLDVMRGLIMILLAAESCLLYTSLKELSAARFFSGLIQQFFHHPWHGLYFWDLVQPAFMLMAGAGMFISFHYKEKKGVSWQQNLPHIALRCLKLFICGTALHCVYAGKLVWELWNVLTQLSLTTLIAYLIIKRTVVFQLVISVLMLLLTEILYRFVLMQGYDQPFVEHKNFGAWFDTILMGKVNSDGWVAINFIPTAAHTIWGVLVGKLLVQSSVGIKKVQTLCIAAVLLLVTGYSLDVFNLTPIIKRISTSSFVLVSGGWVLLILALLYWLTDVKKFVKRGLPFIVIGTNAIFIYLLFETVGVQWLSGAVAIFVNGFTGWFGMPAKIQAVASALVSLLLLWGLCYWLYKKKIFFKL